MTATTQENKSEPPQLCGTMWLKSKDGVENFLRFWQPSKPKAFILYLHGVEGHSLWFEESAKFLAANGITTFAMDRRGSGFSKESRGDMKSWRDLIEDVKTALRYINEQAGSAKVFLMANCWGAKLAALIAQTGSSERALIDGLILSSPAIAVKVDLTFSEKLQVAWRLITQDLKPLPIPLSVEDFTDNPHYLKYITQDPQRLSTATARFLFNTFLLTKMSMRSAEKISVPTIILQSGIDSIVDEQGLRKWYEKLGAKDKQFLLYPEVHHSLDFDKSPDKYRGDLLKWIDEHSCSSRTN